MTTSSTAPMEWAREQGPGGLEFRSLPKAVAPVEARAADGDASPVIEGLGSVYNQVTTIGRYYPIDEVVDPAAWSKSIGEGDIRSMKNHDTNWLLGRTKSGSLRLSEKKAGLYYEIDVNPDDPNAMSTHAQVARGDIDGSSVWFRVIREEWTEPTDSNGLERPLRRILEAELYEVGPVVFPAFEATTSTARSLAPVGSALRAAGVSESRSARLFSDLLSDPAGAEEELRTLFATVPGLQAAACGCDLGRAAVPAPSGAAVPAPDPVVSLSVARARLDMRRR
jgi:HK97 family phage prohead protease